MSYFVAGLGSMGKRRVRCLLANGISPESIIGFDKRADRRQESYDLYRIRTTDRFEDFDADHVKAVIVSLWPHLHTEYLLRIVRAQKNWFCEVPLGLCTEGLEEIAALTSKHRLLGAIGSQMIFHPASRQLQQWLREDALGGIVTCWGVSASYFPGWHPYEKMTDYYLADKAHGGANIDIIGHDIQWLIALLNRKIKSVIAQSSRLSTLELAEGSADTINTLLEFEDGLQLNFHFNGADKSCSRGIWIAGNKTTVMWDMHSPQSRIFDVHQNRWQEEGPTEFDYEWAYVREIEYFLGRIDAGQSDWPIRLQDGIQMARLIEAVHQSISQSGTKQFL